MYVTPETGDGWITEVLDRSETSALVEARFEISPDFRRLVADQEAELVFAARSRLARIGIDICALDAPRVEGDLCRLRLQVVSAIPSFGIGAHLCQIVVPGLRVGRLVFCPESNRLRSTEIHQLIKDNEIQVPAGFSIDSNGYLMIRPQRQRFRFLKPLTLEQVTTIATHADGKDLLNRLQVREAVEHIELQPRDGLVTACSMFLHRHYVVLRNLDEALGFHLQATVLDPVSTRGTRIYLEFINRSEHLIINPSVAASVHQALAVTPPRHYWHGGACTHANPRDHDTAQAYRELVKIFDRLETTRPHEHYSHRMMAVTAHPERLRRGGAPDAIWTQPQIPRDPRGGTDLASGLVAEGLLLDTSAECGISVLDRVPDGARATLLLGYFPNLIEHTEICTAALRRRIGRIVFRRASFEHGSFLSARDHSRLADYEALGIAVFWCNEARGHVVRHVFRGLRGYFTTADQVERFHSSLVFAIYGSVKPMSKPTLQKAERLLANLIGLFGRDISILTGGGPGAMRQITDAAQRLGILVGSSFIETLDQEPNRSADYYQTFQARSRQSRQRWFEIASFHLFLAGGVGTLEEIGLTLTDMKLGVIEAGPVVFFDDSRDTFYWDGLRTQFAQMQRAGRLPDWLLEHLLMTSDPDAVPRFYKQSLRIG
ncbi:hypothetical protein CKO25_01670 [Thiocapsa imhoffii]|uniref:AMP nucleosidase n=1 Tax=Thiocapsa imhoffii TaxID=382777 RepID=A0A9X1B7L8_9GAMM|nr:LOG family protein [Thiocapsa imhoffii]MBK1643383.1 hypothetical protein [Thiocapsa imhoffii]